MKKILLFFVIFLFLFPHFVSAKNIKLSWDKNKEPDVSYKIYSGNEPNKYDRKIIEVDSNTCNLNVVDGSQEMFFAVTAINSAGNESDFSNEVQMPYFPSPPQNITIEIKVKVTIDKGIL